MDPVDPDPQHRENSGDEVCAVLSYQLIQLNLKIVARKKSVQTVRIRKPGELIKKPAIIEEL